MNKIFQRRYSSTSRKSKILPRCVLDQYDKNWIERYTEICTHLCFGDYDQSWFEDFHHDILHDICNENATFEIVLHLLSLLELVTPFLNSEEKIEQTFGSLYNILTAQTDLASTKYSALKGKYLYSATSFMLYNQEWSLKSDSIAALYSKFIDFILQKSQDKNSLYYEHSIHCLHEISVLHPELIDSMVNYKQSGLGYSLFMLPLSHIKQDEYTIREIVQNISFVPDIKFYHLCNQIYKLSCLEKYNDSLSLLILKPFLSTFYMSNEVHNVHLALKLLIKFGFKIFSSFDEEVFLKQLVKTATLPTLPVGHRLLLFSFIKIAFNTIFKPLFNPPPTNLLKSLQPYIFDGPDTQEKKLMILNDSFSIITDDEFYNAWSSLMKMSMVGCDNYQRSTNSLFRIMNISLKKRPQLMDKILVQLLNSMFSPSYFHYIPKLYLFLPEHWQLAQILVNKFIAKLMIVSKDQETNRHNNQQVANNNYLLVMSRNNYITILQFINWFLSIAHHHIQLTEFQLEFLIKFIHRNSSQIFETSTLALTCCTSILYYQRVSSVVKEALLTLLEWLQNESKSNLETSSLAQIYLLALHTLKEEYIKQVFTSDEEEFLIENMPVHDQYLTNIIKNDNQDCPINIERISNVNEINRQKYGNLLYTNLEFAVSLYPTSIFDRLFCVDITFDSYQIDHYKRTFQLPLIEKDSDKYLHRITVTLDFKITSLFELNVSLKFVDLKGTIYNYFLPKREIISLEDIFVPLVFEPDQCFPLIYENVLQHQESLETVICVRGHSTFDTFFNEYEWIKKFIINQNNNEHINSYYNFIINQNNNEHINSYYNFIIGLTPDRLILGKIQIVNKFINIYITTNNYEIVPLLFCKFNYT